MYVIILLVDVAEGESLSAVAAGLQHKVQLHLAVLARAPLEDHPVDLSQAALFLYFSRRIPADLRCHSQAYS